MGGTVAFTLRREDGTCISRHVWTNYWAHFLMDARFIHGESTFFNEYLKDIECQEDVPFAPEGYGLIVVDYKTRQVFHSQGYTNFRNLCSLDFWPEETYPSGQTSGGPDKRILKLIEAGRVYALSFNEEALAWRREAQVSSWEEENRKVMAETAKARQTGELGQVLRYEADLYPWEFSRFDESLEGTNAMKTALEREGFTFTDQDETAWEAFRNRLREIEAEDE